MRHVIATGLLPLFFLIISLTYIHHDYTTMDPTDDVMDNETKISVSRKNKYYYITPRAILTRVCPCTVLRWIFHAAVAVARQLSAI
jgi:hypothetical protein